MSIAKSKWKFIVLLFLSLLLVAEAALIRYPEGSFRASADSSADRHSFRLVEVDNDVDFAVIRLTENKTVIHFEELSFTPVLYTGMAAWSLLTSGEKVRVTITNEFDEWAKVTLTYMITEKGEYKLVGPSDWEWTDFINDEVWTLDFHVYRANDVTLNYRIEAKDIGTVYGYYALPHTEYTFVKDIVEVYEDETLSTVVTDSVMHVLDEVKDGKEATAYGDYYEIDLSGNVNWTSAEGEGGVAPMALSGRGRIWLGVGVAAVGFLCGAATIVFPPLAPAAGWIIFAGIGLVVQGAALMAVGFSQRAQEKINAISEEAQTVPDEAIKEIETNIEFNLGDDEASTEKVVRLAFYNLDDEGNRIGEAIDLFDRSGRPLYYNRNTRVVGNEIYCLLDPDDLYLVRLTLDKKMKAANGTTSFVVMLYSPEDDTGGYFEDLNMPFPEDMESEFWILSTRDKKPPLSFLTKDEYEVQVKNTTDRKNSSKHMILIDDDDAQLAYISKKTSTADNDSVLDTIWNFIKDALGISGSGATGCTKSLSKFVGWLLIILGVILFFLIVWLVAKLIKFLILVGKAIGALFKK